MRKIKYKEMKSQTARVSQLLLAWGKDTLAPAVRERTKCKRKEQVDNNDKSSIAHLLTAIQLIILGGLGRLCVMG